MRFIRKSALDGLFAHQFNSKHGPPSKQLLAWRYGPKADDVGYWVGKPFRHAGCVNTYRPTTLVPKSGRCDAIDELVEWLFPVADERCHLLNVLAFVAQHPGHKVRHALHVRGPQGTGKNTLFCTILKVIVGQSNLHVGAGAALTGRWINWLLGYQVVVIDEVQFDGGWDVQNKLKAPVTELTLDAESKGVDFKPLPTAQLYIILSNFENHLPLEEGDRRAWVPTYGQPRLEPEFYSRLHKALPEEIPTFFARLLARDISDFDPEAPPPMTSAKAQLVAECKPAIERQLAEMIADHEGPFARDLVVPTHVVASLRAAGIPMVSEPAIRRALKRLGCSACKNALPPLPGERLEWAKEQRVWAVRNAEFLATASKGELKEYMIRQFRTGQTPK
jgi:hypothetical protein